MWTIGRAGRVWVWWGLVLVLAVVPVARTQPASPEYSLKAAFICNFTKFVTWPDSTFDSRPRQLRVGVLGEDPFGAALPEVFAKSTLPGGVVFRHAKRVEDLTGCHLLFVAARDRDAVAAALRVVRERPILTVGEAEDFAAMGGIIRFYIESNTVRFEINRGQAEHVGLEISSRLLALARIVASDPKGTSR